MMLKMPSLDALVSIGPAQRVDRRGLTFRYVLALLIIGTVLLGQQALSSLKAGQQSSDGALINVSGSQRMLSQRIAMLANDVVTSSDGSRHAAPAGALRAAWTRMDANQAMLSDDWRQRAHSGDQAFAALLDDSGVAQRVDSFLILARSVLELDERDRADSPIARDAALSLAQTARGDFLDALEHVVGLYERRNLQSIGRLQSAGSLSILFGLAVLVAVALLIFQPMVRTIVETFESLRESREEQFELGRRMSHDLRAPIASSLGVVAIVEEALDEGDVVEAGEAAGKLHGALSRLDNVLAQLMAVTRLHRLVPRYEPVDVAALVAEAVDSKASTARLTVTNAIEAPLVTDRTLLKDILLTLFDNAMVYRKGDTADIIVQLMTTRDGLRLSVQDAGIGIPEQCRTRVFDMFQQFHPDRSRGAGLGLHLAKVSARTLGGRLEYDPLPEGSRFTLTLPSQRTIPS